MGNGIGGVPLFYGPLLFESGGVPLVLVKAINHCMYSRFKICYSDLELKVLSFSCNPQFTSSVAHSRIYFRTNHFFGECCGTNSYILCLDNGLGSPEGFRLRPAKLCCGYFHFLGLTVGSFLQNK
jgi:hypothetical protein